jgi:hypothetical protein
MCAAHWNYLCGKDCGCFARASCSEKIFRGHCRAAENRRNGAKPPGSALVLALVTERGFPVCGIDRGRLCKISR